MASRIPCTSKSSKELQADLQLLLECLNCQIYDPPAVKQSLLGIGNLCSSNDGVKDMLREDGGLQYLLNLLVTTEDCDIQEAAMYTLGCAAENNVYSQKQLTTGVVFSFLRNVLKEPPHKARVHQTACFFLLSLVSNNSQGQTMTRTSGCFSVLLNMFKTCLPEEGCRSAAGDGHQTWFEEIATSRNFQVWAAATSAICGCLNNPQNDENQRLCAGLFPQAFIMLEKHAVPEVVRPIMSLIGLATANNYHNQVRVQTAGGVRVIVSALHSAVNRINDADHKQLAVSIISTIDTFIADNKKVAEECGQHGMVLLLLKLLRCHDLSVETMLRLVISLSHMLEASEAHRRQFVETGGVGTLISMLASAEDKELLKTIKYVLQGCVDTAQELNEQHVPTNRHGSRGSRKQARIDAHPESSLALEKILLQKIENLERQLSTDDQAYLPSALESSETSSLKFPAEVAPTYRSACSHTAPRAPSLQQQQQQQQYPWYTIPPAPATHRQSMAPPGPRSRNVGHGVPCCVPAAGCSVPSGEGQPADGSQPSHVSLHHYEEDVFTARPMGTHPPDHLRHPDHHHHRRQTHGESPGHSQHAASRLQSELHKEKKLRRSIEGKVHDLQLELEARQKEDRAKAVASELLKQVNLTSAKKETMKERSTLRRAKPRARLGDSQCVTSESSVNDSSRDSSPATSPPASVTRKEVLSVVNRQQSTKASSKNIKTSSPLKRTNDHSQKKQVAARKIREKEKVSKTKPPPSSTQQKSDNTDVRATDSESVSIGLQTDDFPIDWCEQEIEQAATPLSKSLPCTSVGVQTPVYLSNNLKEASEVKSYDPSSTIRNTSICTESDPSKEAKGKDSICEQKPATSEDQQSCQQLNEKTRECQVRRPHFTESSPDRKKFTVPAAVSLDRVRSTPRLNRKSLVSGSPVGTPRKYQLSKPAVCPPSPCASEFDFGLLKAASSGPEISDSSGVAQSPRLRIAVNHGLRQHGSMPGTPVNVCKRQPPATYGRTSKSSSSLSRILFENHRDASDCSGEKQRMDSGDGPDRYTEHDATESLGSCEGWTNSPCSSISDSQIRQRLGNTRCPACQAPDAISGPLLNSRTYNFAIETSGTTCRPHRLIREAERRMLRELSLRRSARRNLHTLSKEVKRMDKHKENKDVYDFPSSDSEQENSEVLSPLRDSDSVIMPANKSYHKSRAARRPRIPYSQQEVATLLSAVRRQGKAWHSILTQNSFHPSRTAVDIKDKYKQLMTREAVGRQSGGDRRRRAPFSMAEERRLRRGVKLYGYNWKVIFNAFRFAQGRRSQELRQKWRSMHRT